MFTVTYNDMLRRDIRYVYFGTPIDMKYRHSSDFPTFAEIKRNEDDTELKRGVLKAAAKAYRPADLPAAPAFRTVSRAKADEIGKRLYERGTRCRTGMPQERKKAEKMTDSERKAKSAKQSESSERMARLSTLSSKVRAAQYNETMTLVNTEVCGPKTTAYSLDTAVTAE